MGPPSPSLQVRAHASNLWHSRWPTGRRTGGRRFKSCQPDRSGPEIQRISGPESVRDLIDPPQTLHFDPPYAALTRSSCSWHRSLLVAHDRYGAGSPPVGYEDPTDNIERTGSAGERRRARRILGCADQDDLRLAPDGAWPPRHPDWPSSEVRGIRRDGLARHAARCHTTPRFANGVSGRG